MATDRKEVIDSTTDNVRVARVVVRLGLESQMTKFAAREALRAEIAGQTNQLADGGAPPPSNGSSGIATFR
jgi:hypothetical protein